MGRLDGRVTVVTGGAGGIGRAIAERFVSEGARVVITGRQPARLAETARAIGPEVTWEVGDATSRADMGAVFDRVRSALGPVHALVANAASQQLAHFAEVTEEEFTTRVDAVLRSTYFTVQQALPALADPASVILLASTAAHIGQPYNSLYQAAKAGVRSLARSLSAELHEQGVRVNVLTPGLTQTSMGGGNVDRHLTVDADAVKKLYRSTIDAITLGRPAEPAEMAGAAAFLASDDSSYMLGSEIVVDGGATTL